MQEEINQENQFNSERERLKERLIKTTDGITNNDRKLLKIYTSFLPEDSCFGERRQYLINDYTEIQKCPVCGKKVYFIEKRRDLSIFCSKECKFSKEGQSLRLENERKSILKNHIEKSENYKEAETKEELKEKIKNFSNPSIWMQCLTEKEIDLLIKVTNFLPEDVSMSERQCYLLNDYTETKLCPVCGKKVKYLSNHHRIGLFCSIECMRSEKGEKIRGAKIGNNRLEIKVKDPKRFAEIKERTEKTNFEKYGGSAPCSNKDISDRGKRKRREKYFKTFLKEIDLCNLTYISSFEEYIVMQK